MWLIELFMELQINEFSVPQQEEMNYLIDKYRQCQQQSEYSEECANVVEKYMKRKEEMGGIYGNIQ